MPPHRISPGPHEHTPAAQLPPEHTVPHELQWFTLVCRSTHAPEHSVRPVGHAHVPELHTCPARHTVEHVPQRFASVIKFTHPTVGQAISGAPHPHVPPVQLMPAPHVTPHPPQFIESFAVSTHAPPQAVRPIGQPHIPAVHEAPAGHRFPQAPQFSGSDCRRKHPVPHIVRPAPHVDAHVPAVHRGIAPPHGAAAHDPQCAGSDMRSTHVPLQLVNPVGHRHRPPVQVIRPGHTELQVPQFIGSVLVFAHDAPHVMRPPEHTHSDETHVWPAPHR